MKKLCFLIIVSCFTTSASETPVIPKELTAFLNDYCIQCHGPKKSKADFRVDQLRIIENASQAEEWQLVLDNLHLGEMPPEDEKQADTKLINKVTEWIEKELSRARKVLKGHTGEVVLRRLNRFEYDNTIEDLFGVQGSFTDSFPEDAQEDGFDNNGAALMLSTAQIQAYMSSAEKVLNKTIKTGQRPVHKSDERNLQMQNKGLWGQHAKRQKSYKSETPEQTRIRLDKLPPKERKKQLEDQKKFQQDPYWDFIYPAWENGKLRAPRPNDPETTEYAYYRTSFGYQNPRSSMYIQKPGWYKFTINAYAVRTQVEGIRLKITHSSPRPGIIPKLSGYAYLKENTPQEYSFDVYLEKGERVRVQEADKGSKWMTAKEGLKYQGPMTIIKSIKFEGPIVKQWPGKGHTNLLGNTDINKLNKDQVRELLSNFAPKLFRRHVGSAVIEKYTVLFEQFAKTVSPAEAYKLTLKAMMVSPRFLYHQEAAGKVDDYALASRLSYFLWRSTPDDELLKLAKQKKISQQKILKEQISRMLQDKKSERFLKDFTKQWLQTYKVGEIMPDKQLYPKYDKLLEEAMVEETQSFIKEVFRNNLSIDNLIDSDWSILNERLAKHYGIPGVKGLQMRKVKFDKAATIRGGLMTHASILNITSNGTTTSPVVRGVWLMEHLLGIPPSPPPPDVPPIEPDIRGATTIKEQLLKHREIQTCKECHKKIDPFGVALENFGVTGAWRLNYEALKPGKNKRMQLAKGKAVEPDDTIPSMGSYKNFDEFRKLIFKNRKIVYHNMAHKLATFALGRSLDFSDREYLDQIVMATAKKDKGLQTMVYELILNPIFRKP
ncbi:MAG: DUF1592 domain-containing protein [Lentisphaerales bacterium]|nr:DUF1592 domain-containing protein [Lentisphaerales bacterium]